MHSPISNISNLVVYLTLTGGVCTNWYPSEEIVKIGDRRAGNFKASVEVEIPVGTKEDKYSTKILYNADITSDSKELVYLEVQLPPACE